VDRPEPELAELVRWVSRALLTDRLVEYAIARHGFENSDIGCGVIYADPGGNHETAHIPRGHIEIYAGRGAPDGFEAITTEDNYLAILADTLRAKGEADAAAKLDAFRARLAGSG
jgi:hypothetical protein